MQFEGEDGIDSGGLGKEFFALCAAALVAAAAAPPAATASGVATAPIAPGAAAAAVAVPAASRAGRGGGPAAAAVEAAPAGRAFFQDDGTSAGVTLRVAGSSVGSAAASSGEWRSVGRFVGKALVDRQLVPALQLSPPLLKRLLGRPVIPKR